MKFFLFTRFICNVKKTFRINRSSSVTIMLSKASLMRDYETYDDLIARARTPHEAKRLGRRVSNWNETLWKDTVCEIAVSVVSQKVDSDPFIKDLLLSTGDKIIAEMTANDQNWGTGVSIGSQNQNIPQNWTGSNILGWALMHVRHKLQSENQSFVSQRR